LQEFLSLEENPQIYEKYKDVGTKWRRGNFKISGLFIYDEESSSILFPVPADFFAINDEILTKCPLATTPPIYISDIQLDQSLVFKGRQNIKEGSGFFNELELKEYLEGECNELRFRGIEEIFLEEAKVGIKRQKATLTSEEGCLYRIPMLRLKAGFCFLLKVEGTNAFPDKGILQLGAEGKTTEFEIVKENFLEELENVSFKLEDGIFKLYFATPSVFKNGWLPSWIDNETLEGEYGGIRVKLVGAAIRKFKLVGGWNLAEGRPKPMYRAVPEGSIYYFKVLSKASEEDVKKAFHFKNISDENSVEGSEVVRSDARQIEKE